jgi:ribosomal subunit interface protein
VDIVVTGRHTGVPSRFREHAEAKLAKLERYDHKILRLNAELCRERNPRLSGSRERVELTVISRGPVIRAEAAAADPCAALDLAAAKLAERMRRAADRRRRHAAGGRAGHHGVVGIGLSSAGRVAEAAAGGAGGAADLGEPVRLSGTDRAAGTGRRGADANGADANSSDVNGADAAGAGARGAGPGVSPRQDRRRGDVADGRLAIRDEPPMVVREKTHESEPMSLDDALSNMELVGHDFYLFVDADNGLPSVVYRRCGYDYGLIRLRVAEGSPGASDSPSEAADQTRRETRDSVPMA